LRAQAKEFPPKIASSTLSKVKAFYTYQQYYKPKLGYSLPALALTKAQCNSIQSPSVCALLSKLHLNQHTARAILHGPQALGGLQLLDLYTIQGVGQIQLFIGRTQLADKTGNPIHIDLSYVQLLVGTMALFLNTSHTQQGHSTEGGWLDSLWEFLNSVRFQVNLSTPIVPP